MRLSYNFYFKYTKIILLLLFLSGCIYQKREDKKESNIKKFPQQILIDEIKSFIDRVDANNKTCSFFEYKIDSLGKVKELTITDGIDRAGYEPDFWNKILALKDLEYLKLDFSGSDDKIDFGNFPKLRHVELKNIDVQRPGHYKISLKNPKLDYISLSFQNRRLGLHILNIEGQAENLKGIKINAFTMQELNFNNAVFPKLESLDISSFIEKIYLINFPKLEFLNIFSHSFSHPDSLQLNTKEIKRITLYGKQAYKNKKSFEEKFRNKIGIIPY